MDYIQEFVVSLGFETKMPELQQFQKGIKQAESTVASSVSQLGGLFKKCGGDSENAAQRAGKAMLEMTEQLLKWQARIVGMFAGIAVATIGVADKIAMADQEFRLFSMRMFMTQEAGKRLNDAGRSR